MNEFLINALLMGGLFSLLSGPLGSIILWKRLAFFGDTLAHGALLGLSLSVLLDTHFIGGILIILILLTLILSYHSEMPWMSSDIRLAILSPSLLGLGIICFSLIKGSRMNLESYLFGDILSVTKEDIVIFFIGLIIMVLFIIMQWRSLINICISEDLAIVEGYNVYKVRVAFLFLLALFIGLSVKVMGALLITALLIMPAALARNFSRTPESMAIYAIGFSLVMVMLGLFTSSFYDIPTAPAIVLSGFSIIVILELSKLLRSKK